jgi:hypothetical protein
VIAADPVVPLADFERATGWDLKPEGACRGDVCIPLARPAGGLVDLREVGPALHMPVLHDGSARLWALGPAAGPVLASAAAPDFTLPDRRGGEFSLSSLRGRKVAVVAWAPW